jgi:hypothetical protein
LKKWKIAASAYGFCGFLFWTVTFGKSFSLASLTAFPIMILLWPIAPWLDSPHGVIIDRMVIVPEKPAVYAPPQVRLRKPKPPVARLPKFDVQADPQIPPEETKP